MQIPEEPLKILKRELYLYVDTECCGCGRLIALSNARNIGHHKYCGRCYELNKSKEEVLKEN